ncbi:HdeD family acid-resistance protein [Listeria ivanovii]|uniref:HdeD family acid-resistance protein n=1 Tax=Listeria ivanovii (strain ATCC BAA-678 / PAM 55) TaxID=881621 RepID=G2ZEY1_LISIP|nr:HdeD family acid-resistance protein [Listeria ivanovii]AHI56793.1 membrane protein [Listeria ivanovii WSLC3009]AIS66210.1 membrane protein [Listeria ivanovii subsp. ivanovii]MBC1760449.1 HdeD family acid-resistance protein [Listeria ivanovii]MBK3913770.1 HdeD family acid-resistance protein [Listeria ivanovii subsp. ivanovii]MBK3921392.1 HdeD family acid-resistance protein [Listeria ivanovii subsp. ivanovii]
MRKVYLYFVLLLGIVMIGLGIYLIFNPSTSLKALTIFIGIILVLNGINEVISYFGERKYWSISKWIMLDGILSIVVGAFAIFQSNMAERIFIIIFAIWILASAVLRILTAFSVKGLPGWTLLLVMGILGLIIAIISLFTNTLVAIAIGIILGVFFILQGVTCLSLWRVMRKGESKA